MFGAVANLLSHSVFVVGGLLAAHAIYTTIRHRAPQARILSGDSLLHTKGQHNRHGSWRTPGGYLGFRGRS